jgi:hypothetical protein
MWHASGCPLLGLAACGRLGFDAATDAGARDGLDAAPVVGPWAQVLPQHQPSPLSWIAHVYPALANDSLQQLGTGGAHACSRPAATLVKLLAVA